MGSTRARRARTLVGRRAECEFLDTVLADARAGRSRVVVLRGEAGSGKTALLDFVAGRDAGWQVATAVGIELEMELAYSGLHQLCSPMLDHLDRLPTPQRGALATVFGHEPGPAPDRFLVGLATLTLLAEVADRQPLVCLIDDAQWLDDASARIFSFVARRLLAERIALVCAVRSGVGDDTLSGLPVLPVDGLGDSDARALLLESMHGPLDAAVCEQLINESRGNPLALLELPRTWTITDVAGGFGLPMHQPVVSSVEESFVTRLLPLPSETQLLVLTAAAEPLGDPLLLHRAAGILGLDMAMSGPAVDAGLLDVTERVAFAHPLVRSAAYHSATADDRYRVHHALAQATDAERDPDRCVWHRARATPTPNEDVAAELEHSADRARARGGVAAAAAFLERASALSPDPGKRARRALAAAEAKQLAGAHQAASRLLGIAVRGSLDELESAVAQRLKGQIALDMRRAGEAAPFLLEAARRLEPLKPELARDTYLDALQAASIGGRFSEETLRRTAEAARHAAAPGEARSAEDVLLAGLAIRFTDGYPTAAAPLKQALGAFRDQAPDTVQDVRWPGIVRRIAPDLFHDEAWHDLARRSVQLARDRGALGVLPLALNNLSLVRTYEGDLEAAGALVEESDAITDVTGEGRILFAALTLAGFRGDEAAVSEQIATGEAAASDRGEGVMLTVGEHARALLNNGLARYDAARTAAESGSSRDQLLLSNCSMIELVEAAVRSGRTDLAAVTLERLGERTQAAGTEWALGIEARSRALLNEGPQAEALYLEAIDRLARTRIAPERARAHLLYGEWLRRERRRVDAREQLRTAHDMLATFGMDAFAERARRELAATGEKVRQRRAETLDELTAQEAQIAQLAHDGLSNPQIAAQLFLSARTVEWHLRKVFQKLGVSSRRDLSRAFASRGRQPSAPV
jgi:DNA-binding CsgD family transcriptional regulator